MPQDTPQPKRLVWSYTRTSTGAQAAEDRSGLDRQNEALDAWLKAHPEFELQDSLSDPGVSGGRGKHRKKGAMGRFIAAVKAGTVPTGSVLLIESVSRYTREVNSDALGSFLSDLQLGIGIAFTQFNGGAIITKERWDKDPGLKFGLLAAMDAARTEWEEKQARSLGACRKRRRLQDEGVITAGRIPWWMARQADGSVGLDPVNTATVRRMVELATDGWGQNRLASLLQTEARLNPRTGTIWTGRMVRHTLIHTALNGDLVRRDRTIHGYYPAVLSPAEHLALQQALAAATAAHDASGRRVHGRFLFQGLSRCSHCGGPLSRQRPNPNGRADHPGYVRCQRAAVRQRDADGNLCPGGTGSILLDAFEAHALTRLRTTDWAERFRQPGQEDQLQELTRLHRDLSATHQRDQARLEQLEQRAERLFEDNADDEMLATANRATVKLRARLSEIKSELATVEKRLAIINSRPQLEQLAADMRKTIASFMRDVSAAPPMRIEQQADGKRKTAAPTPEDLEILDRRAEFTGWLATRSPSVSFMLDVSGGRVAMQIGDGAPEWKPLAAAGRKVALAQGMVDPSVHERADGTVQVVDWDGGRGWDTSDIDPAG